MHDLGQRLTGHCRALTPVREPGMLEEGERAGPELDLRGCRGQGSTREAPLSGRTKWAAIML